MVKALCEFWVILPYKYKVKYEIVDKGMVSGFLLLQSKALRFTSLLVDAS